MAFFVNAGVAAILWFGSKWVDYGGMQVGQIMAFVSYMASILTSLNMISNTLNMFVRVRASHRRIVEVFNTESGDELAGVKQRPGGYGAGGGTQGIMETPEMPETQASQEIQASREVQARQKTREQQNAPHIELRGLGFQYRGSTGQPALLDISFSIEKGETLGIIGPTGSGKSTLAALLLRFYEPTNGEIFVNGVPLTDSGESEWRSRVAIVPQSPMLFTGTIKENIAWGKMGAADDEIEYAARDAQAYGFITSSEEGFDRLLGQAGAGLSGGQKQRISIARALVRDPELLVLDDCTSALDVITEAAVKDALAQRSMTVVFITQRVATARGCDKILVLENGSMAGFGSHEDLKVSCPVYRDIYRSQIGGENNG